MFALERQKRILELLAQDGAVLVSGYVQSRDDEDIKFIVASVEELQKNGEYSPNNRKSNREVQDVKAEQSFGAPQKTKKLYLRVPDLICEAFAKAKNLVEIFEGSVEVIFYDNSTKQYKSSGLGFEATEYTLKELKNILGNENVVLK